MSTVNDPPLKPWLADDQSFQTSIEDLDRGLDEGGEGHDSAAIEPPPRPPRQMNPSMSVRIQDAPASAPPLTSARPADAADPPPRRALLDLFPAVPAHNERPPGPLLGTAVGPRLPHAVAVRHTAPAASSTPAPFDPLTYETFYGLEEKPFSQSTDPKFFYHGASHERCAQDVLAAIRGRTGVALLTGEPGMGKTTLCRAIIGEIDRRTLTSLILEPVPTIDDLLTTVLVDFGVISREDLARTPAVTREVLARTLVSFLESLVPLQASAVVIIDEAQDLPVAMLEQLGVLAAGEPESRALQIVLVGQPVLSAVLQRERLRQLHDGVSARADLGPLARDEIAGYVMHRLSVAGSHSRVDFSDAAFARIHDVSKGVPRIVNLLCDRALSRGYQLSASVIDAPLIEAAAVDFDLGAPVAERSGAVCFFLTAVALLLLMMTGAAGALWVSRDAVTRTIDQWEKVPSPPGGPAWLLPLPLAPIPPPDDVDLPADNLQAPPSI
jgi:type II secretory pathway predicted ATPase ExeA